MAEKRTIAERLSGPTRVAIQGTAILSLLPLLAFFVGCLYLFLKRAEPVLGGNEARAELARAVSTMPGRNGRWWLDDDKTYWMLPVVRAQLAKRIKAESADAQQIADASPSKKFPADQIFEHPEEWSKAAEKIVLDARGSPTFAGRLQGFEVLDPNAADSPRIAERLQAELDRIPKDNVSTNRHLRALLLHKLALQPPKPSDDSETAVQSANTWKLAEAEYGEAIKLYKWYDLELLAVCHADFARLLDSRGKLDQAVAHFKTARGLLQENSPREDLQKALVSWEKKRVEAVEKVEQKQLDDRIQETKDVLLAPIQDFLVDCYTAEAAAFRRNGQWTKSMDLLDQALMGVGSGQLRAYVQERRAWHLMDRWQVREAQKCFEEAKRLREDYWSRGFGKNNVTRNLVFHDRHGIAMANRYLGKNGAATREYDRIIADLKNVLQTDLSTVDRHDFQDRLLNTLERRADCELFGCPKGGAAVLWLTRTREYADDVELLEDRNWQRLAQLLYKRSLADVLSDKLKHREHAVQTFNKVRTFLSPKVHSPKLNLVRAIASAVIDDPSCDASRDDQAIGGKPAVEGLTDSLRSPTTANHSSLPNNDSDRLFRTIHQQYVLLNNRHLLSRDELDLLLLASRQLTGGQERYLHSRLIEQLAQVPQREAKEAPETKRILETRDERDKNAQDLLPYLRSSYDAAIKLMLLREAKEKEKEKEKEKAEADWRLAGQYIVESFEGFDRHEFGPVLAVFFDNNNSGGSKSQTQLSGHAILMNDLDGGHYRLAGVRPDDVKRLVERTSFPKKTLNEALQELKPWAIATLHSSETTVMVRFKVGSSPKLPKAE